VWRQVELLLVYMWHHNASLFANLCGIAAGYGYCLLAGLTVDIPLVGRIDPASLGLGYAPLRGAAGGFYAPNVGGFFDNLFGGAQNWGSNDAPAGGGAGAGYGGGRGRDWGAASGRSTGGAGNTTGGAAGRGYTAGWRGGGGGGGGGAYPSPAPAPPPAPQGGGGGGGYGNRMGYQPGVAVRIFGLVNAAQHNGKIARVVRPRLLRLLHLLHLRRQQRGPPAQSTVDR
jgi:hypothetical protein